MSGDANTGTSVLALPERVLYIPGVDLVVVEGPNAGKRARIQHGAARVGTGSSNQLILSDRAVSRTSYPARPRYRWQQPCSASCR